MTKSLKILLPLVLVFFLGLIVSYIFNNNGAQQNVNMDNFTSLSPYKDFIFILINNSISLLVLLSSLILGIWLTYFFYFINGFLIGVFLAKTNIKIFLISILPHGIMEICSFLALGVIIILIKKEIPVSKYYFFLGYTGLVISAFIEAFITPNILKFFY
ncbi:MULTISPECIES: stage II sporulation protein M [Staphylococcus]|uniref:stage II sporulation protein M n=1 Tax=Staphylococcus TaxID=1279 RepID=UPI000C348FF6|nr:MULTISPECIES: stage II sporulation protein M [Staphylococcus]MEB5784495.1 stage II sporulation protein M [Staphylococcus pseudoxylosus]PKI11424.1 hypothetical protein CW743_13700 [Staphylococcus shinii]RIM91306.1 hypothetical protein BU100_12715 [Staphylococcus xylosus]